MNSINLLTELLLRKVPDKDPASLTFYHFLKYLRDPNEPITPQLIYDFYLSALSFEHWQKNRDKIALEVEGSISTYASAHQLDIGLDLIPRPQDIQIFTIESQKEFEQIVEQNVNSELTDKDKARLIVDDSQRTFIFLLRSNGSFEVREYSRLATVLNGQIKTLPPTTQLFYNSDLGLAHNISQKVNLGNFVTAHFVCKPSIIRWMLLRGYTMQRFEVFEGHRLSDIPKLFYAIKGIEQYFIKRESDPLYIEVTSYLEQIIEMVRLGYPDAIQTGHEALDRAQMALQNIFPGDKTLTLLIRALEGSLALSQKDFVELNPEVDSCQKPQELN